MAALASVQAPALDGGIFLPLIDFAADAIGDGNSSSSSSSSSSSVGSSLLQWLLLRLSDRIASFVVGGLWAALVLAAFVLLLVVMRRRKEEGAEAQQQQKSVCSNQHLPAALSCLLLILLVPLLVLLVAYFVSLGQMYILVSTDTSSNSSDTAAGAVNLMVHEVATFVEESLTETNRTVLAVSYEKLPQLLELFNELATRLLDLLSLDFDLAPLLRSLDEFIALVKQLLDSMKAIRDSRFTVVPGITSFEALLNGTRQELLDQLASICSRSPGNGVSPELCRSSRSSLQLLTVQLDHRRIESDSSVTVVTLLDKIFKLNITEIEIQVAGVKSMLTGSLDMIKDEVMKLFNQMVAELSKGFASALDGAGDLLATMRGITRQPTFRDAIGGVNTAVVAFTIVLTVILVAMWSLLLLIGACVLKFWWHSQQVGRLQRRQNDAAMGGWGPPPENLYADVSANGESLPKPSAAAHDSPDWQATGKKIQRHCERRYDSTRLVTWWTIVASFVLAILMSFAFVVGLLLLVAGAEVQNGACRYVTDERGVAKLDELVDGLLTERVTPLLQGLVAKEKIPISVTAASLPSGVVDAVLRDCGNDSATIFQIFDLMSIVNVSEVLEADVVQKELDGAETMIRKLVGGLNITTLIPKEVDAVLATLPEFATVVDTQDYSASIAELRKPLLPAASSAPSLVADLRTIADVNPSDSASVILRHYADRLHQLLTNSTLAVETSTRQLLGHFTLLQDNRRVLAMTNRVIADLGKLKVSMGNVAAVQASIGARFAEVKAAYLPKIALLVDELLQRLLQSVGRCTRLHSAAVVMQDACNGGLMSVLTVGLFILLTALLLHLMMALLMWKLHLVRQHKKAAGRERTANVYETELSTC